ncbi:MAG: hypothetical protein ABH840_03695 [Nanoarchaeota archaeon]
MIKKRGQVTIFIIIGIIILAGIVIYFLIANRTSIGIETPSISDPESYIEKCARDAASDAIDIMLPQGGWIDPLHYRLFENNKVQYLCYTNLFYKSCVFQEPLYIAHLENEITGNIDGKVDRCFSELKSGLIDEGYEIDMGNMDIKTELGTGFVRVNIDRNFVMTKHGETRKIEKFKSIFNSPLYKLAIVGQEIANQEAKFCYFEYVGFMLLYSDFNIVKKNVGSGLNASKIYTIEDRYTNKKLNIAVRSCAIPPAF